MIVLLKTFTIDCRTRTIDCQSDIQYTYRIPCKNSVILPNILWEIYIKTFQIKARIRKIICI